MQSISATSGAAAIHLNPQAPLAERVLLPGDPHRALAIAQACLDSQRMFNTRRGLWGYTGRASDGGEVTVQASGMGGPSAAIVVEELIALGARRFVRVGTCGAFDGSLRLGEIVVVTAAIATDGTSRALGADERIEPTEAITGALSATGARQVVAVSTDLFYGGDDGELDRWRGAGGQVVEMEAATLFAVAERAGVEAGCLLAVTDLLGDGRTRIEDEELERVGIRLGEAGLAGFRSAPARS